MDVGLVLPTMPVGASAEGIAAAAEAAERLGWHSVWTTDHVLVDAADAERYGFIFEALTTLAWVGARTQRVRLGTSVIVVPQRNAVVLAKELATLDALTGGRVVVGVGVGWSEAEFANLGAADRFAVRGAYLDETIRLWRHLWSGSQAPFEGRFHRFAGFAFGPLPAQGEGLPIVVGGRSRAALRRAATLGDGYQFHQEGPDELARRLPDLREEAARADRPVPPLAARLNVRFDAGGAARSASRGGNTLRGDPLEMRRGLDAWAGLGVEEVIVAFGETTPMAMVAAMERFDRDVLRGTAAGAARHGGGAKAG